jgi:hypothetical protein
MKILHFRWALLPGQKWWRSQLKDASIALMKRALEGCVTPNVRAKLGPTV